MSLKGHSYGYEEGVRGRQRVAGDSVARDAAPGSAFKAAGTVLCPDRGGGYTWDQLERGLHSVNLGN